MSEVHGCQDLLKMWMYRRCAGKNVKISCGDVAHDVLKCVALWVGECCAIDWKSPGIRFRKNCICLVAHCTYCMPVVFVLCDCEVTVNVNM